MQEKRNTSALRVGTAVMDITPQCPVDLCGFPYAERTADGIHDHLTVTVVHLRNGAGSLLLISFDLFALDSQLVEAIRAEVCE
ncbi:MAG: hypothetical protein R6V03_02715 [Kiritimatiellia bacterium]